MNGNYFHLSRQLNPGWRAQDAHHCFMTSPFTRHWVSEAVRFGEGLKSHRFKESRMAPAFEARPHLYYIIESHRFHTYPLFSIIHTAAMCTHPVQPICTFSCTSVFIIYIYYPQYTVLHILSHCTSYSFYFIICSLFILIYIYIYIYIFSCVMLHFFFFFFFLYIYFFCTFHWADLSWLTFHYWLYPVWLCMWQIIKNLEPWVDRLKSQQCFSPLSRAAGEQHLQTDGGIKRDSFPGWRNTISDARTSKRKLVHGRPCASESGSSLGWRHVTLAFRNPHDAAKSSQTKQTRRDLPLPSTRTHGSHLRRLAWKQSQILWKWQTVLVSCGLFVTDFPCSLTVKRPVIQKAFCLRATDTSLGFLYKSSLLPSSVA